MDGERAREEEFQADWESQEPHEADMRSIHDVQKEEEEDEAIARDSATEPVQSDPQLEHLLTVDDFGLDAVLARFLQAPSMNLQALVHIIKVFDPDPHKPSTQLTRVFSDLYDVLKKDHGYTRPTLFFCQDMMALRRTVRSMLKPVFNSRVS